LVDRYRDRVNRLAEYMIESEIDFILLTKSPNIRYFTGYNGDGVAVISADGTCLLYVEDTYLEEAERDSQDYVEVIRVRNYLEPLDLFASDFSEKRARIGYDKLSAEHYLKLTSALRNMIITQAHDVIWKIRQQKDKSEIERIREAAKIISNATEFAFDLLSSEAHVSEIKALLLEELIRQGADDIPATPEVRSISENLPHGACVVLNITASKNGYHAQVVRTLSVGGEYSPEVLKLIEHLETWFRDHLEKLSSWTASITVFDSFKEEISKLGGDLRLSRMIGHGIGLELVEEPEISSTSKALIPDSSTIVVKPLLRLPSSNWVSIGDTYEVKKDGLEKLSTLDYAIR